MSSCIPIATKPVSVVMDPDVNVLAVFEVAEQ